MDTRLFCSPARLKFIKTGTFRGIYSPINVRMLIGRSGPLKRKHKAGIFIVLTALMLIAATHVAHAALQSGVVVEDDVQLSTWQGEISGDVDEDNFPKSEIETPNKSGLINISWDVIKFIVFVILSLVAIFYGRLGAIAAISALKEKRDTKGNGTKLDESIKQDQLELPTSMISNLPPRNPWFSGRDEYLEVIEEAFKKGESVALSQVQAITGLGGIGKTQIAKEYAWRHIDDYDIIWWMQSEDTAKLSADYAALGRKLDIVEEGVSDQDKINDCVREHLGQTDKRWLLIFDNAVEPKDLIDYRPSGGNGDILITSRKLVWTSIAKCVPVETWPIEESVKYIISRVKNAGEDDAGELAEELGNFPLAIAQAVSYITNQGVSIAKYLELYRKNRPDMLKEGDAGSFYENTVATTWELSFIELEIDNPLSAQLMNLLAFFGPENIPEVMSNLV